MLCLPDFLTKSSLAALLAASALAALLAGVGVAAPALAIEAPDVEPTKGDAVPLLKPRVKATFEGFFVNIDLGYSGTGGEAGPLIPDMQAGAGEVQASYGTFQAWKAKGCLIGANACYNRAITTDRGGGLAAAIQLGYNIKGYADLALDLAWSGSFGSTADMAGIGTVSTLIGIHPLRFWRDDLPVDVRLYSGFGVFEVLYYYETEFQTEAKGKAWTGTSIPFGLQTEYKIDRDGVFALGADLRFVRGSYNKWIYNNDKDIASRIDDEPITTLRFAPRLTFGFHF